MMLSGSFFLITRRKISGKRFRPGRRTTGHWWMRGWRSQDSRSQKPLQSEKYKANSIRYQINAIGEITVIEWFSDAGFLPRYGFPIHLQRLSVRIPKSGTEEKSKTSEKYRLERAVADCAE